jgi:hypothetical protein
MTRRRAMVSIAMATPHNGAVIMSNPKSNPIVIKLPDDSGASQASPLFAYVVDGDGKVVETTQFKGRLAHLAANAQAVKGSRLFVGAAFPPDYPSSKIDAYALSEAGAYQVSVAFNKDNEIAIQRLPTNIGIIPPIRICEVQGNISNTVLINGVPQSGPVCCARVHICTVDWFFRWPIWLRPVIPPSVLDDLKDSIVALHEKRPVSRIRSKASSVPAVRASSRVTSQTRSASTQLKRLPSDIETQLLSATPDTIQEIVSAHSAILYPYFCAWPIFWPWFYRVVEQEVVYTDCNGHFDGWLISIGAPAVENIYVWAEASIGGCWVTIYNPPFPCNTYWNYACGTEIDITLNNPAIPPCNCGATVVDGSVWFTAIGQYGIASNVQQDETSVYGPGDIATVGCTNLYDGNQLCPFGSTLDLSLAFGPTLPATHYRWSWSYLLDSSLNPVTSATPNVITGAVERYYLWPLTDGSYETGSIPLLDTDADGNIAYLVPNYDVTSYPGVPAEAEWVSFNFLSASLDSTKINNGYVIQLNLELLNKNSAGLFEVASVPVSTFQISVDTNPATAYGGSVPAPYTSSGSGNNYLTLDPSTPGNALSLSLKVRVDNSDVTADINQAWLLDGSGVPLPGGGSGPCGFIQFTNPSQNLLLSFVASEPFNFATFGYDVTKGDSGASVVSAGGYVFESAPPFTLSGGVFSDAASVASLLGTCPQAAFAESLSVYSLATDGTNALWESGYPYYAEETNAFALTPS